MGPQWLGASWPVLRWLSVWDVAVSGAFWGREECEQKCDLGDDGVTAKIMSVTPSHLVICIDSEVR